MGKYNKLLLQCISHSEDELQLHQLGLLRCDHSLCSALQPCGTLTSSLVGVALKLRVNL